MAGRRKEQSCGREDSISGTLPLAHGMGTTSLRTMTMIGLEYQPWFFRDGRKDSWRPSFTP